MTQNKSQKVDTYSNFKDFYPFYLSQHADISCRRLHFVGSILVLVILFTSFYSGQYGWLLSLPIVGYGFAWVGHFFFEKNKPATFTYPGYSFMGDWVMFWDILTGKISINHE